MLLFLTAAFVVACSLTAIAMAMYVIWRESSLVIEEAEARVFTPPGHESVLMTIPGKYPAHRTRHSRVIKS